MARGGTGKLDGVKAMMAGAEVVPIGAAANGNAAPTPSPAPGAGRFAGDDEAPAKDQPWERNSRRRGQGPAEPELPMLPTGCPVVPLGKRGQVFYFLDQLGEMIALPADKVAQKGIQALFGTQVGLLREFWPRFGKPSRKGAPPEVTGVEYAIASETLMAVCAGEGVFDPVGRVRGRGAHVGADGALILHCGAKLLIGAGEDLLADGTRRPREARWYDPGRHAGFVYPTGPAAPRPAPDPADTAPGQFVLALFGSWNWKRPIDPVLLLGWNVAAMIGGALAWRPHAWVTGDSATGKSTLQQVLEDLHDGALLQSADASEAGVRQVLGQDTLPVALDEAEAEENSAKINALVKLARLASSGTMGLRGGADHKGHVFAIRSSFLFSSVLMPSMLPQDRNRLAILELEPFDLKAVPPVRDPVKMRAVGRQIRRRVFDQWHRFEPTLADYRRLLSEHGHGGRSADVFGTLLACADLVLYDYAGAEADADDDMGRLAAMDGWAAGLAAATLTEKAGEMSNSDRCVEHLASSALPAISGKAPMTVGRWCVTALSELGLDDAKERLGLVGLRVVQRKADEDGKVRTADPGPDVYLPKRIDGSAPVDTLFLAIAAAHRGLDPLFRDTPWQRRSGTTGGWSQAFGRVKGHVANQRIRIDGKTQACTLVPLTAFVDLGPEGDA